MQMYVSGMTHTSTEKLFTYRKIIRYTVFRELYVSLYCVNIYPQIMYERKIPIDLDCPLRLTMSLIGSKWKSCIVDELRHKPLRPSELHKIFPEATPRVLDIQLKELVEDGLVNKTTYNEVPLRTEYALTDLGRSLLPIIDAMIEWGNRNTDLFERKYGEKAGYHQPKET